MASNRPEKIGKYDVIDIIGRGGMGIIYKATDPYLGRLVAIKVMTVGYADNPDLLKRFFREAQSTGSLQHPNIVTVYELGDHGGNPYLVMEYLEGESLDAIIATHRQLNLLEKIDLMMDVCHGLSYAHRRGIVHRDIKPANIMVSKDRGVKIVDFGIAHIGDTNITRTGTGQIIGSLNYMSPEQVNGRPVDARTDIFSTGVVLYQLITSGLPFEGESTASTLLKIIHEPPPPLKNFLTVYPPELEAIILRALAKDREARYASADDFALDLSQLQGQLKQELITQHLKDATRLLERAELYQAKEQLLRVLKIDRQHSRASHLLREVQEKIQRQEISEQVRQLRLEAEEARVQGRFETALGLLERALNLDKNNLELERLRESVKAAWLGAQKLHQALQAAASAHQAGDLDSAKHAVEEALGIAPNDTEAKALYRAIHRDWVERSRQRQVENHLQDARREMASRKFTAALEALKQAEALDPGAPQIRALLEAAAAGREQERRRRELEAFNREIEDALNRDDYRRACGKADEALQRFPEEGTLLKLKALADKQRQIAERKQFVDEQLSLARKLLEEGRSEELVGVLEAALAKIGNEVRLQSLLLIVRENVQRERAERRKSDYLERAKDSLRRKDYAAAIRILETARTELKDALEIEDLLAFAKEEAVADRERERQRNVALALESSRRALAEQDYATALRLLEECGRVQGRTRELEQQIAEVENQRSMAAREALERALREARTLVMATEYRAVLERLASVVQLVPIVPVALQSAYHGLQQQASMGITHQRKTQIEHHVAAGELTRAAELLRESLAEFPESPDLLGLGKVIREETSHRSEAQRALAEAQNSLRKAAWKQGGELLEKAYWAAQRAPLVQKQVLNHFVQAAEAAVESDWRAAHALLQQLAELQPQYPQPLRVESRIAERRRQEFVTHCSGQAKRLHASGDLRGALQEVARGLSTYPDDSGLQELHGVIQESIRREEEHAQRERARLDKEAFIQRAIQDAEPVLERRIGILEEALARFPEEPRLQRQLSETRDLWKRVTAIVESARAQENAGKYGEALRQWTSLRAIYSQFPELTSNVARVTKLYERARATEKSGRIQRIQGALVSADYDRLADLLTQAKQEFPGDRELLNLEEKFQEGLKLRTKAQKIAADGHKALGKKQWKKAAAFLARASNVAGPDPVVREQVLSELLEGCKAALDTNWQPAEMLLAEAAELQPASPLLSPLRARIERQKRDPIIERYMTTAARAQSDSDLEGALRELERGLSAYPGEPRLSQLKNKIEVRLQQQEQQRQRQREVEKERARQLELEQRQAQLKRQQELERDRTKEGEQEQKPTRVVEFPAGADLGTAPDRASATRLFIHGATAGPGAAPPRVIATEVTSSSANVEPPGNPPSTAIPSGWRDDTLRTVERQLATFIGPLARILVRRAASRTTDPEQFYALLAASLDREADRQAFLAGKVELSQSWTNSPSPREPRQAGSAATPTDAASQSEVTPAAIDRAAHILARHVGPISGLLAKKAARRADSLRTLYLLLAEHVKSKTERDRFLRDAGFPDL